MAHDLSDNGSYKFLLLISMINKQKVALITGAAHRLGKNIAVELHAKGIDIAIHCGESIDAANSLCEQLNAKRNNSAGVFQADFKDIDAANTLINKVIGHFNRLDYLVNNASIFYPTPFLETPTTELNQLLQINFTQPIKLLKAAFPYLEKNRGSAINIIDIYAERGLADHCDYVASKTSLLEATKELAYEFAPKVRVNAVSPGAILWPENDSDELYQKSIIENTALKRQGTPNDISKTVAYLLIDAVYTTGSLISVDGGRGMYI